MTSLLSFSVAGLLLVDLPVALVGLIASLRYGLVDTFVAVYDWRAAHPVSYVVSAVLLLMVLRKARILSWLVAFVLAIVAAIVGIAVLVVWLDMVGGQPV